MHSRYQRRSLRNNPWLWGLTLVIVVSALEGTIMVSVAACRSGGSIGKQAGTTLNAAKAAEGLWKRQIEYDWSIQKQVVPSVLEIKTGDSGSVQYTIFAAWDDGTQTDLLGAQGEVCVTNAGEVMTKGLKIVD